MWSTLRRVGLSWTWCVDPGVGFCVRRFAGSNTSEVSPTVTHPFKSTTFSITVSEMLNLKSFHVRSKMFRIPFFRDQHSKETIILSKTCYSIYSSYAIHIFWLPIRHFDYNHDLLFIFPITDDLNHPNDTTGIKPYEPKTFQCHEEAFPGNNCIYVNR